jgi:hypothetical protein
MVNRIGYFHNDECLSLFISKNKEKMINKGRAKIAKEERKEIKKAKEGLKTAGEYIKEAQAAVNRYIRARDFNKPCISCDTEKVSVFGGYKGSCGWDAGHYRPRGSAGHLRFNVLNIHKQCVKCNRWLSGNVVEYRVRLIERIGLERVEALENDNSLRSFDIDYLKRVKKIFNKRARWYEKRVNK